MKCETCGSELKECTISGLTSDGPEKYLVCKECGHVVLKKEEEE